MKTNVWVLILIISLPVSNNAQITGEYEVYALQLCPSFKVSLAYASVGGSDRDSLQACGMFWLVQGNGKNILVDAGFISENNKCIKPDSALRRLNIQPNDISDIILTHPHSDHIGGIELFPSAQVWMQKEDYAYFVGEAWQKTGFNEGFKKNDVKSIVNKNLEGKLILIQGDSLELFPGIRIFIGSKHTWESMYVLVQTKKDKVILASDNCWFYYNLNNLISIPKYTFDAKAYVRQMQRMKTLQPDTKFIIPGHDPMIFSRFPKVARDIVKIE